MTHLTDRNTSEKSPFSQQPHERFTTTHTKFRPRKGALAERYRGAHKLCGNTLGLGTLDPQTCLPRTGARVATGRGPHATHRARSTDRSVFSRACVWGARACVCLGALQPGGVYQREKRQGTIRVPLEYPHPRGRTRLYCMMIASRERRDADSHVCMSMMHSIQFYSNMHGRLVVSSYNAGCFSFFSKPKLCAWVRVTWRLGGARHTLCNQALLATGASAPP